MTVACKECGSGCCVCECEGSWAAHCMTCENTIGKRGFYDPCANSKEEAIAKWNEINNAQLVIFEKVYDGESMVDLYRDISEIYDFSPTIKQVPSDEYGIHKGTFKVSITWNAE